MHLSLDYKLFVDLGHPHVALLFTGKILVSLNCQVALVHRLPFWLLEHIWSHPSTLAALKVLSLPQNGHDAGFGTPVL